MERRSLAIAAEDPNLHLVAAAEMPLDNHANAVEVLLTADSKRSRWSSNVARTLSLLYPDMCETFLPRSGVVLEPVSFALRSIASVPPSAVLAVLLVVVDAHAPPLPPFADVTFVALDHTLVREPTWHTRRRSLSDVVWGKYVFRNQILEPSVLHLPGPRAQKTVHL